ncbi:MAG TPA: tryptophan synthase subunit alpha, partial [Elusimicrobiota bacterium]|nr:tryptophan synthase subunit alpha [Elusimicrobiota bacterium]
MNRLDRTFSRLRRQKRKALIAYLTAGYPSPKEMDRTARLLEHAGVDVLEVGIPFSDPVADGPTIQYSSQKSLEKGTTLPRVLRWTRRFRKTSSLPVVFMSYLNPIHHYGYARFAKDAAKAGGDGLIVPDLVPEESRALRKLLAVHGLHLIHLVAPTSPPARQQRIARLTRGFLYAVSLTG